MSGSSALASARAAAVRRLQDTYPDEWERIYSEERVKRGLPPQVSDATLAEQNRVLRYRIQELESERAIAKGAP